MHFLFDTLRWGIYLTYGTYITQAPFKRGTFLSVEVDFAILHAIMKQFFFLFGFLALLLAGCVNQSINARRSDIPWNAPSRSEATGALPSSLIDQYE